MAQRVGRWIGILALAALGVFVLYVLWAREPVIDPMAPLPPGRLPPRLVAAGAGLASVGNCESCHSVLPQALFAGGAAIRTPFGALYGSNITPDAETGIGRWSLDAFRRTMKEGVSADGRHLYPGMPYEHFSALSDDDIAAIYAFLMTRPAVHAEAPHNRLIWPTNYRPFLAAWKTLFVRPGRFVPQSSSDPVWNRGAYLAEALAHCGSCHNPRNALGAEKDERRLSGGVADNWKAPAIDGSGVRWRSDELERYLRTGRGPDGTIARGPMREVVRSLSRSPSHDVRAIAVYIAERMATHGR
jgi:mono/diheme cytochrome c family protein